MKKIFTKTLISSALLVSTGVANAAAFQLAEVSTSGLGVAYAGDAATASNASVVATNPALMTLFKNNQISAGGVLVDADVNINGTIAGKDASHQNIIPRGFVPNLYVVAPITENFAIGGGMNVNYGLKSRFEPNYNAGVYGGLTSLKAINLNLSGAYKLGYGFSAGVGVNAIYSKAELVRHLGVGGQVLAQRLGAAATNPRIGAMLAQNPALAAQLNGAAQSLAQMKNDTEVSRLKGDKWSFGWNAGLMYEINENHRIGVAYHSAVNVKFKGQYSNGFPSQYNGLINQLSALGVALPVNMATGGEQIPGRLNLHLPAYWEISTYNKLTDKLALQFSYKRTEWEKFRALEATAENGKTLFQKDEYFNDSSRIALGVSYDATPDLTLRAGMAYDETASLKHPSISIPDTDRTWYSVGATYRITPNLSTDIGFAHLRGSDNRFQEGGAVFSVKSRANLYGLNLNYSF